MAKKIYKYPIGSHGHLYEIEGRFVRVLDVQNQGYGAVLWAEVCDDLPITTLKIMSVGTGWEFDFPEDTEYIGTIQDFEGYVWHYYMRKVG